MIWHGIILNYPAMSNGLDTLTLKERETLRLILRGHDAKSMARELGLSVHTINERLRVARRKLEVTSSKEAARKLYESEGGMAEMLGHKHLGDAAIEAYAHLGAVSGDDCPRQTQTILIGVALMSIILAASLALQAPTPDVSSVGPPAAVAKETSGQPVGPAMREKLESAEHAALVMLEVADNEEFELTAKRPIPNDNNFAAWNALIERRQQFGRALSRDTHRIDVIERDGLDEWVVRFLTDFEHLQGTYEKVTLAYDGAGFIVKEYEIE